uniref:Ig-like domain-containing protein n=1 Tax=Amphilophus citrinellus TaxID=61819 RepID=A0A3Q0T0W3_AMPCI
VAAPWRLPGGQTGAGSSRSLVFAFRQNIQCSYKNLVQIVSIEQGTLNLTGLDMLKMNHNQMVSLPRDAFSNLKDLKSLRLNNNRFVTIAEGMFDGLLSLSHLQIYDNPFDCTCFLDWLRVWISTTTISVTEQSSITCATPKKLKGKEIWKLPESKCSSPNVTVWTEPDIPNAQFYEGSKLVLTCEFEGNPEPLVQWSIHSKRRKRELILFFAEEGSAESNEDSSIFVVLFICAITYGSLPFYRNMTLLKQPSMLQHSVNEWSASCQATFDCRWMFSRQTQLGHK